MQAKLIGYNEIPIEIAPINSTEQENLTIQEPSVKRFIAKSHSGTEQSSSPSSCKVNNSETTKHIDPDTSLTNGGSQRDTSTARSRLYEICTANCWKAPKFECCNEEGPGHLKLFTYKVLVEIEDGPETVLECLGSAHPTKRAAAENAAEGALWFLEKQGYL